MQVVSQVSQQSMAQDARLHVQLLLAGRIGALFLHLFAHWMHLQKRFAQHVASHMTTSQGLQTFHRNVFHIFGSSFGDVIGTIHYIHYTGWIAWG